jgi:beta-barrel assembly-enhancing protease
MRIRHFFRCGLALVLASLMAIMPTAAQVNLTLPDLGDSSQSGLSPAQERKIGEEVMREIRFQEVSYLDDAELEDYLNTLGNRLVSASTLRGQEFTFFLLKDPSINAFAMPGGYIGVHTGLLMAAQTESELASVLAHEIGHVAQRHIARQMAAQSNATVTMLASLLVAILASRVPNSQMSEAAVVAGQAAAIQNQLSYSRDFEREADRVGFQTLEAAGFDVQGMPAFFERLQRANRLNESNAPSYLRTHPLTIDRISDMQNRAQNVKYRQVVDSPEFTLVRTKLEATSGTPAEAVARYTARTGTREVDQMIKFYGLARAQLRANAPPEAARALDALRALKVSSPMIEGLAAEVASVQGKYADAARICRDGRAHYPRSHALLYCEIDAYLDGKTPQQALDKLRDLIFNTQDDRLYAFQARAYEALNQPAQQHRALAEMYVLRGNVSAAIDQLRIAQKSGGGDYYEQASIDARLRELRARQMEDKKGKDGRDPDRS